MALMEFIRNQALKFLACKTEAAPEQQAIDLSTAFNSAMGLDKFNSTLNQSEVATKFFRWQYAAAVAIAESIMAVPWEIQKLEKDEWVAAPEHPMNTVFSNVNFWMTSEEFRYWAGLDLVMIGESYWRIVLNGLNEPAELWPILGNMEPVLETEDGVSKLVSWKHTYIDSKSHGQKEELVDPELVIYLRCPKPRDIWKGYGAFQAAGASIEIDEQVLKSEWSTFKQGVFTSVVLNLNNSLVKGSLKRRQFMRKFNEMYSGAANQGKAIGIPEGVTLNWPKRVNEFAFVKSEEGVRDNILGTLRVPPAILGMQQDVNRASAEAIEYIFSKYRIQPMIAMIEARLNQDLFYRYFDDTLRVRFQTVIPANREIELQEEDTYLRNGVLTINEVRAKHGYAEVDWGHVPLLPAAMIPFGTAPEPAQQGLGLQKQQVTREQRSHIAREFAKAKADTQKKFELAYQDIFRELGKELIDAWATVKEEEVQKWIIQDKPKIPKAVSKVLDVDKLAAKIEKQTKDINRKGVFLGGNFERDISGEAESVWDESLEEIDAASKKYAADYKELGKVTREEYVETINRGIQEHETLDELKLRIVAKTGMMVESRANAIATTESTKLFGAGEQAFRNVNQVPYKRWICSFVNSRQSHIDADNQTVKNGEMFRVGSDSMMFPGTGSQAKENVNCSCCAVGSFTK